MCNEKVLADAIKNFSINQNLVTLTFSLIALGYGEALELCELRCFGIIMSTIVITAWGLGGK